MTDEGVVRRIAAVTGVGTVRMFIPRSPGHKRSWYWTVNVQEHNEWLIKMLAPFLGQRRRRAAERQWSNLRAT